MCKQRMKGEVMNEPTMETLARRLDRVERENLRFKKAVVGVLKKRKSS